MVLNRILIGHYPLHRKLPSERKLCAEIGISRSVLRVALKRLSDEGVIWQHIGKGSFVGGSPCSVAAAPENPRQ